MTISRLLPAAFAASVFMAALAMPASAQVGGSLLAPPPVDIDITISENADGKPSFEPREIRLTTGEYYRFNVTSDGETDWRLELPDLLQNAHLRVVTVNDGVEIHLQSMVFRAIEFDEPNKVSFSFVPLRPGTYAYTVGRNPIAQGLVAGQAGVREAEFSDEGQVIVE